MCQDVVLKAAVKTYQGKCWRRISTHLPGKTEVSTTRTYEYQYMLYHTIPSTCVPQIALFFFLLSPRIQFIYSSIDVSSQMAYPTFFALFYLFVSHIYPLYPLHFHYIAWGKGIKKHIFYPSPMCSPYTSHISSKFSLNPLKVPSKFRLKSL